MQGSVVELGGMGKLPHEEVARCPLLIRSSALAGATRVDLLPG